MAFPPWLSVATMTHPLSLIHVTRFSLTVWVINQGSPRFNLWVASPGQEALGL